MSAELGHAMSEIVEGAGGIAEGALVGRAVEPNRGANSEDAAAPSETCSNCGAIASGTYCSNCGQKLHVHRTLSAIGHDLMHGVLHLDGKLFKTLPLLAFKPGKLTRRYIEGERAKFVSPMAMFLFSVFAMFAVFQMVGLSVPWDLRETVNFDAASEEIRAQGAREAEELRARIEAMPQGDPERQKAEQQLQLLEGFLQSGEEETPADKSGFDESAAAQAEFDLRDLEESFSLTGNKTFDQGFLKKWRENPGLMLYKLQANGYKFSWLLIPLSIPFVWLLFAWRREFKAYDHAVFVTYSLSFMSLLFIMVSLIGVSPVGIGWAFAILAIAAPIHLYKHLRHSYGLSRLSTLWRFVLLNFFVLIVVLLFMQALLLLGAF
ncbi:DUF3667 domain-containing protein [Erythrobacter sp. YT30]|uniref:DUF3667 domain-containing protein n=1 Tax=Erythrobacter sp. YT30 TaxID=1735012 RepID=UPI000AE48599|nr:DUF3667 domain-containing protein [Erythrobacter sp. YT30]